MTAARLAALALLVVVARHVQVTGRILGVAAAVVALALLASMLVRARLSWSPLAQRTGAAISEAARQFARAPAHPLRQAEAGQ